MTSTITGRLALSRQYQAAAQEQGSEEELS